MERQKQMDLQWKANEADLDRDNDVLVAKIRSAGYGAMMDINKNMQSDYQDALVKIDQQRNQADTINLKREEQMTKREQGKEKINVEKERIAAQKDIANKQLQIARENKNKYDVKSKDKK